MTIDEARRILDQYARDNDGDISTAIKTVLLCVPRSEPARNPGNQRHLEPQNRWLTGTEGLTVDDGWLQADDHQSSKQAK